MDKEKRRTELKHMLKLLNDYEFHELRALLETEIKELDNPTANRFV